MGRFVFSGDGHLREPKGLFSDGLPASLRKFGIHTQRDDSHIMTFAGEKLVHRFPLRRETTTDENDPANNGRPNAKGAIDLDARIQDMTMEGIDAEIMFPTTGMLNYLIEDRETEAASARLYNDWNTSFVSGHLDRFVRCGLLPVRSLDDTVAEMERLAAMGFTAAMLPSQIPCGVPLYNDPAWDKVFDAAQRLEMVLTLHTATGRPDLRPEAGPGGAIINYTDQMRDAIQSIMYMVAGGTLDRFPGAKVMVVESGASWLAGLAERMDEVAEGHAIFVRPKLSVKPSEIIKRQVYASFQYDRACIMSRSVTGHKGLVWGSDYPHHEGTFPDSREVVGTLFDGIDISEEEKADIVGLNGARLFRLPHPAVTQPAT
ncbi:MAG: amidohydrolase [Sphingomonadaceae bacterium]|nr:amidohydrolase [Sphingomonadaceae bacterium]